MAIFTGIATALFAGSALAGTWVVGATAFALQTAVGIGLSYAAKAIAGQPQAPGFSVKGKLQAAGDVPRSYGVGLFGTAGSLVYANTWGNVDDTPNAYFTQVIALADLPGHTLAQVFVYGEPCTLADTPHASRGYPVLQYRKSGKDYLWVKFYDGTQLTADGFLTGTVASAGRPYASTRVGYGICYAIVTALVHESLFTGFPTLKFSLNGIPLYDRSKDASVGGTGTHDVDDPETWGGDGDHFPACQIDSILRGIYYDDRWFYGLQGMVPLRIPSAGLIAQIEKCRTVITGPDGAEPTWRTGIEIQVNRPIADTVEVLMTGCQGRLAEFGGMYDLHIGAPPTVPDFAIEDDDILTSEERRGTPFFSLTDSINGIVGKYPNPTEAWATKPTPPIYRTDLEIRDGNRQLMGDVSLDAVPYKGQAQRVLKAALAEAQRARRHTFVLPPRFWKFAVPNAIMEWTSSRNGYDAKHFRIDGAVDRANADVMVDVTEIDPDDYDWDQEVDYTPPVDAPTGPIRPPSQPMVSWDAQPATITKNGVSRPGIEVTFAGNLVDVQWVQVQVRYADNEEVVFDGTITYGELTDGDPKSYVLDSSKFIRNTDYEVRGKFIPFSDRETDFSTWLAVTTPNVGISEGELDPLFASLFEYLKIGNEASLHAYLEEHAEQIAALSAQTGGLYAIIEKTANAIFASVGASFKDAFARIDVLAQATASDREVLATLLFNLIAKNSLGQSVSLLRFNALASDDKLYSGVEMGVMVEKDGDVAESAVLLEAYYDAVYGLISRFTLKTQSALVKYPSGRVLQLQALGQYAGFKEAEIIADTPTDRLEIDLFENDLTHIAEITDDVIVDFPRNAAGVISVKLAIVNPPSGAPTIGWNPQAYIGDAPSYDTGVNIVNIFEIMVLSLDPPMAGATLWKSGVLAAGTDRQFTIFPAVSGRTTWDLDAYGPCTIPPGSYVLTPIGDYLLATVSVRGPGGSSGIAYWDDGSTPNITYQSSSDGTASRFQSSFDQIANAGGRSGNEFDPEGGTVNGAGGTASGGTTNTTGTAGGDGYPRSGTEIALGGQGGASPSGGGTAIPIQQASNGQQAGTPGNAPGGGASGGAWRALGPGGGGFIFRGSAAGGGGGGLSVRAYTASQLPGLVPINVTVGDSGNAGIRLSGTATYTANGAKGAAGEIIIT